MRNLLLAILFLLPPANPQILTNPVQDYINKTTLLNNILSNARANTMIQQSQTGSKPTSPAPQKSPDPGKFARTSAPILPKKLAEKAASTPQQRQQAEQAFGALIGLYEQTAKKDGFPPNDLAYALEYFVVNSYMTVHNLHEVEYEKDPDVKKGKDMFERLTIINRKKTERITPAWERTVYGQMKTTLTEASAVRSMSDVEKQELTELLAIMLGLNLKTYMDGVNKGDDGLMNQARQAASNYLEKLTGTPIARIRIDARGLQIQ